MAIITVAAMAVSETEDCFEHCTTCDAADAALFIELTSASAAAYNANVTMFLPCSGVRLPFQCLDRVVCRPSGRVVIQEEQWMRIKCCYSCRSIGAFAPIMATVVVACIIAQ